ncbi:hypothetical protein GCM10023100_10640 [Actinocorallia cavernae]|uniref:Secreted protein n=2 Tax=Actinomycetes TaxID=1760 RepID=A0ABP5Z920_9ACTN
MAADRPRIRLRRVGWLGMAVLVVRWCGWGGGRGAGSEDLGEEVPGAGVLRVVQHLGGRALFDDPAAVDEDDPVGDLAGEADLMGDDDQGGAAGGEVLDDGEDLADEFRVERGGRLVEEDDAGAQREGAGDGDAPPVP